MVKTILFVGFHPSFSRHGITRASSVLLIWLNENVRFCFAMLWKRAAANAGKALKRCSLSAEGRFRFPVKRRGLG